MAEIKRCREPFAIEVDGITRVVPAGEVISTDDAVYNRSTRDFFESVAVHVDRQAGRRAAASGRVEAATADPGQARSITPPKEPDGDERFDPGQHTVRDVLAYLADADDAERERVLAAETAGQARKGILAAPPE
ncbi:hypothetical protein [Streptomyces sp. NPDC005953]|uniref:hypothetical protein n=1 Tax=Streptomyces sp. NPDC005953 TaxID=3156719 RepID=UPI0033DD732B